MTRRPRAACPSTPETNPRATSTPRGRGTCSTAGPGKTHCEPTRPFICAGARVARRSTPCVR
eukprot:1286784-Heterocapsa_arctica.AAC.1